MSTLPRSDMGKLLTTAIVSALLSGGGVLFATNINVAKNDVTMVEVRADVDEIRQHFAEIRTELASKTASRYTKTDAARDVQIFTSTVESMTEILTAMSASTEDQLKVIEARMTRNEANINRALTRSSENRGILKSNISQSK